MAVIDYGAALAGDQTLHDALAAIAAARTANRSLLDASHYSDLIRFGEIPQDVGFDVPQHYRDLADQATAAGFSTIGQLRQKYADLQNQAFGRIGERGFAVSGDYGYQGNRLLQQQGVERANALDQLLQGFNTEQGNYLNQENTLNQQVGTETQNAWQRIIDQINAGQLGSSPGGSTAASGTSTGSGSALRTIPSDHPTVARPIVPGTNYLQTHSSDAGMRSTFTPLRKPAAPVVPRISTVGYTGSGWRYPGHAAYKPLL